MFKEFIDNNNSLSRASELDSEISVYPVSEDNLESLKIIILNSIRMGEGPNLNIKVASIHPSMWLGDLLDKHFDKISYVSKLPTFRMLRIKDGKIESMQYNTESITIISEKELDDFFNNSKWRKFVLFYICKYANLETMKTYYTIKYADISEKYEVRDNKINELLN